MKFFGADSFLMILNESIKLLPKNGKLIALIAMLSIILYSTSHFLFAYLFNSLIVDLVVASQQSFMPNPSSNFTLETSSNSAQSTSHTSQDVALLLSLEAAFCLSFATISLFLAISTIIVSSASYTGKTLSLKELLLRIRTTWTRPLITNFYISGLTIGYFFFTVTLVTPLLVIMYHNYLATLLVAIFLAIIAFIFYLYLFVAWALAIVVSTVEESCYGTEALGKAAVLVRGKRLHAWLLNICSNFVVFIILQGYKMIFVDKGLTNPTVNVLFSVSVFTVVNILLAVAYTVMYFECKKHHGEEIELHGSLEYTKLANDQLGNDMP